MPVTVTMPQMGESVVEGTIERWLVHEGDRVEKDQILCEVSTDKVDAEIPSPEDGVLSRILVAQGETVAVGTEIAVLEPRAKGAAKEKEAPAAAAPSAVPTVQGEEGAPEEPSEEPRRYSPLVRRMAAEHGVDLEQVPAAREGRVTKEDLLAFLDQRGAGAQAGRETVPPPAARQEPAAAPVRPGTLLDLLAPMRVPVYEPREGDRVVPFNAVRRRIAEHMVVSKIVSPHVGTVAEVDLHRVVRLRGGAKGRFEQEHGFKLTYLPFVVHATVRALRDFPGLNAAVVGQTTVERAGIHVGVAVETERGLVVPVIRNTDRLSLSGIACAVEELASRARGRELTADDLAGGTFTVTNPGREGNLFGLAVINQPQVGILRMGEVRKRPVVVEENGEDHIAIRPMMYLALSYDHRVIDGVTGNGFLYRVARYLEAGDFEI